MMNARLKAFLVLAAILIAAALAYEMRPTRYMSDELGKPDLETIFPAKFSDWRIDSGIAMVMPSPQTQALLNSIYNQTLTRTYVNSSGDRIMLTVAYGGDQSDATRAHLPEVCYPAQGFQITYNTSQELHLADRRVHTRLLMSKLGARNEPITYWLIFGDRIPSSLVDQKLTQLRLGLHGLIPDGMLVRVSSITPDMAEGHRLQFQFLSDLANALPDRARDRILGSLH